MLMVSVFIIVFFIVVVKNVIDYKNFYVKINSNSYILFSLNSGKIVYKKNSRKKISVGSLNKILTTIVSIEKIESMNLENQIHIKEEYIANVDPIASIAGISANDDLTIFEVLCSIMLASGADATSIISFYLCGNEKKMISEMNRKAIELGMNDTFLMNTSGLDDELQFTTLEDVLKLLKYSIKNEIFIDLFTKREFYSIGLNKTIENKNLRYFEDIDFHYVIGAKSGYTKQAGYCLATLASNGVENVLLITANAGEMDSAENPAFVDAVNILTHIF